MNDDTQPENAVAPATPEQPAENKDTQGQGFKFGATDDDKETEGHTSRVAGVTNDQPVDEEHKDTQGQGFKFGATDDEPVGDDREEEETEGHGGHYNG